MLSTKTESFAGRLRNPFASHESIYSGLGDTFFQYNNTLQGNMELLKGKFPLEEDSRIKELLEELDNRVEMVVEILLEEQQDKSQMISEKVVPKKMSLQDQNRMLKNSIATLFKKLRKQEKELEELKVDCGRAKRENEDLKLQNGLLMEREFNTILEEKRDIYEY